jgi:carbamoyl-phosphate synthase large subunit
MKSVGEVMAIGRTFAESMQKALRGLEIGVSGFDAKLVVRNDDDLSSIKRELSVPGPERIFYVADAFRAGMTLEEVNEYSMIDPWFLAEIEAILLSEARLADVTLSELGRDDLWFLKRQGFSDLRLAKLLRTSETQVRTARLAHGVKPVYKRVDTCAAEFPAATAYMYSTYEEECESRPTTNEKIMVLGGGPNRIGQGIEFDYCCVHAAFAMREDGYETIMVNCNPETVSTDYDTSDRLYFEPVTLEDVLAIVELEKPKGIIVQFGGQTPLKLVAALHELGVPILGTTADAIDRAEDRERFQQALIKLDLLQPPNATATGVEDGLAAARALGFPLVVRPSYVLGGRAMEIVFGEDDLRRYLRNAFEVSNAAPVLLDRFLDQAVEIDVDAVCDGREVVIGAIMEHIEQAGVHSGDSACSLPPYRLSPELQTEIRAQVKRMALELGVVGLMNVQLAVQEGRVYVLEVNPRASRTVPFVSKCIGLSLAKVAARCMAGTSLAEQGFTEEIVPNFFAVKEAVFPFNKFPGVDPILGPEMKSTGEVMGVGATFAEAFAKASKGGGTNIPRGGRAFLSVRDVDKAGIVGVARDLREMGFRLLATRGTARVLKEVGLEVQIVNKVTEGRPDIADMLKNEKLEFIVNTTDGRKAIEDSAIIRRLALQKKVCYTTTLAGAEAFCLAMKHGQAQDVRRLQDLHAGIAR